MFIINFVLIILGFLKVFSVGGGAIWQPSALRFIFQEELLHADVTL